MERTPRSTQEQLDEYRRIVADALTELHADVRRNAFQTYGLEEAADAQIDALAVQRSRVQKVKTDLLNSIEAIKNTPASSFRAESASSDASTERT